MHNIPFIPDGIDNLSRDSRSSRVTYQRRGKVSLRSVLILFRILHVTTMFGNEGEGFLHACVSSIKGIPNGFPCRIA